MKRKHEYKLLISSSIFAFTEVMRVYALVNGDFGLHLSHERISSRLYVCPSSHRTGSRIS